MAIMLPRMLNPSRSRKNDTRKRSAAPEQAKRPGFFGGIWLFFKQSLTK